jgi:hypothetical protein
VAASGTYYIKGTNSNSCYTIEPVIVTVNTKSVSVLPSGTTKICSGNSQTFTVSGNNLTYQWYIGGSSLGSVATSSAYNANASGIYSCMVSNACGTGLTSSSSTLTINPLPAANAGTSQPLCTGSSVTIGATAVGGDTYSWASNPAGFNSTSANPNVNPTVTTTYTLTETITATGCNNSNSVVITVVQKPTAPTLASQTPTQSSICAGQKVSVTTNPGSGGSGCADACLAYIDGTPKPYTCGDTIG